MAQRKRSPAKGKKPAATGGKKAKKGGKKSQLPPPPPESPRRSSHSKRSTGLSSPRVIQGDGVYAPSPLMATNAIQNRKSLTPWMTGGHLMRAPDKPRLTVPKDWTTRSGRFRPSETGWGFDARSTVGRMTGLSVFSGMGGGTGDGMMDHARISRRDLEIAEIEDPETNEAFQKDLEEKGIKPVIVVDCEWETRSNVSTVSLSDTSYILDLAQQKQFRAKERQEEALEEAFILYKAALKEGAVDDEQMFFMLLNEVKKELDQKYAEKDKKNDRDLDSALEAEIARREKEEKKKGMQESEHNQEYGIDVGRRNSIVTGLIADEEYYHEVEERQQEYQKKTPETTSNVKQVEYSRGPRPAPKPTIEKNGPGTKSVGFFSCCGKDVESSVLIATTNTIREDESKAMQQRDPDFFKRLRRKQAEKDELKKKNTQIELSDVDMWWKDKSIEVSVPEIDNDIPSATTRGNESRSTTHAAEQKKSTGSMSSNDSPISRKNGPLSACQKSPIQKDPKLRRRMTNPVLESPSSPRHKKSSSISSLSSSEKRSNSPRKEKKEFLSPKKLRKSNSKSPKRKKRLENDSANSDDLRSAKKNGKNMKTSKSSDALPSPSKKAKKTKRLQSKDPSGQDSSEIFYDKKPKKRKSKKKLTDNG
jgi:hypothetical protein